jgi:hypothetical protein
LLLCVQALENGEVKLLDLLLQALENRRRLYLSFLNRQLIRLQGLLRRLFLGQVVRLPQKVIRAIRCQASF